MFSKISHAFHFTNETKTKFRLDGPSKTLPRKRLGALAIKAWRSKVIASPRFAQPFLQHWFFVINLQIS